MSGVDDLGTGLTVHTFLRKANSESHNLSVQVNVNSEDVAA